jgi:hypothetical protein
MKVTFSVVSEFMQDLEADKECIEDKILRVSLVYQQVRDLPVVQLSVVAGCIIRSKIVELRLDCGQMFAPQAGMERHFTNEVRLAEQLQATLREEAARLGLTLRGGVLEESRESIRERTC